MVKTCCALQCQNRSRKSDSSFFCFPRTPERREAWVRRINRRRFQPTRHTVLCSDHFATDCFVNGSVPEFLQLIGLEQRVVRRRLMPGAVPTLFRREEGAWMEGDGVARSEDDEDVQQEEAEEGGGSRKDVSGAANGGPGRTRMQLRKKTPRKVLTEFTEFEDDEEEPMEDTTDEDAAAAAAMASGSFDILVDNAEQGKTCLEAEKTKLPHERAVSAPDEGRGNHYDVRGHDHNKTSSPLHVSEPRAASKTPTARSSLYLPGEQWGFQQSALLAEQTAKRRRKSYARGPAAVHESGKQAAMLSSSTEKPEACSSEISEEDVSRESAPAEEGKADRDSTDNSEQNVDTMSDAGPAADVSDGQHGEPQLHTEMFNTICIESVRSVMDREMMENKRKSVAGGDLSPLQTTQEQKGDMLSKPDRGDGVRTALLPTSTSKASKRKSPPSRICQRDSKQPILEIILSSSPRAEARTSASAPGPVLYRLDSAFCSVPTIFEVPINNAPPLTSRSPKMAALRENSPHISITMAEQKPTTKPMTHETATTKKILKGEPSLGNVKGDSSLSAPCPEPLVLERQKEVGGSPCSKTGTNHSASGKAEVCTLACCSGKPSALSWLNFANIPIKQEVMDHDSDLPPFSNPSELWPLPVTAEDPEQADLKHLVPRTSTPTAVPYRSQPLHLAAQAINLQSAIKKTSPRHPIPYRSEPLRALQPPTNPLRQEPGERAKRAPPADDDPDYVPKVERSVKSKKSSRSKSGARPMSSQSAADPEAALSQNVKAEPRGLLAQQLLQGVPGGQETMGSSSSSIKSTVLDAGLPWKSQSLRTSFAALQQAVHTQIGLQTALLPMTTASQVSNISPSQATSSLQLSSGPIFIRSEHIMVDLIDVFKHSSDKIHKGTVFKLCSRVGPSAGGDNGGGSLGPPSQLLQDTWEDVSHKKLFTLFWKECLAVHFEGYQDKVPRLESQDSCHNMPYVLGQVLRHGLLLCGYWPVALSPACAVSIISGDKCSSHILLQSFFKVMYTFEAQTLEDLRDSAFAALDHSTQPARSHILRSLQVGEVERRKKVERYLAVKGENRVGHVVDTYGGSNCKVPTAPEEVDAFILELASYYLYCQPFWFLREVRRGFLAMTEHTWGDQDYLSAMTERHVVEMYQALIPSPRALISRLNFTFLSGIPVENRHWKTRNYLERCFLKLSHHDMRRLVERWSQADCLLADCYVSVASSLDLATPPYFRSAQNLLVLPATPSTSFQAFYYIIRSLLDSGSCSCKA